MRERIEKTDPLVSSLVEAFRLAKTKHEIVTEFRSSEILEAATKVFSSKGFADTTVDEIADEAGIAKGTIYLYFRSKRDIYIAALKQGVRLANDAVRQKLAAEGSFRDKLQ